MTAAVEAAAKAGTRKKIARCVHHQPTAPATAAIKMLPMRSQMTFRASRGSSASCGTSPSVIAATVGAKEGAQYRHHHIGCENHRQNGRLLNGEGAGRKKDGRADQDRPLEPRSVNHRSGRNMKANADQARDGQHDAHRAAVQPAAVTRNTLTKGPKPPCISARKKFTASSR